LGAAKAASDEATGKNNGRVFVWKYTVELEEPDPETGRTTEDRQFTLPLPRKYKRFKFAKRLATGDIVAALAVIVGQDSPALVELEELELDDDEFEIFMERLGEAIGGTTAKN
jgi:hypothetical protein